ncbi:helix-turn-helix domain-containing protein [Hyphobacterium sp.]|uniref:AlbA family DNA-binding domain-containing protein n=1 Tax=Hyphobacterium sp. TaxID=2004662 RepID=UPI003BAB4A5B
MPRKSITDEEIALIKTMLSRGMRNKDIQFFFNRPDRAVNSGRITGIRNGSYANSDSIEPASDEVLFEFVATFGSAEGPKAIVVPRDSTASEAITEEQKLRDLFRTGKSGLLTLSVGESSEHECKLSFHKKHAAKWLRAVAGLANNRGGYIFFGVHDKGTKGPNGEDYSHVVAGLDNDTFEKTDPAEISMRLRSTFDPTPSFTVIKLDIEQKMIGVIGVEPHPSPPVIAVKNDGDQIKEGDIFYRYPGETTRIKYSDLRAILDARDKTARSEILPMIEKVLELGPENTMIANLENGSLEDARRQIVIDEELLKRIKFLREGDFEQNSGAAALRLVGDVKAIKTASPSATELGLINRNDVIEAFLTQTTPFDPRLAIRYAIESSQGERLPLHYFISAAGLSAAQANKLIDELNGPSWRKSKYKSWLKKNSAFRIRSKKSESDMTRISSGVLPEIADSKDASRISLLIASIEASENVERSFILDVLGRCYKLACEGSEASNVRLAVCRVDELFFSPN